MKVGSFVLGISFAILAASLACSKPDAGASNSASGTKATAASAGGDPARDLFKQRCVACHGDGGKGDGPGAAALTPKPRNYPDKAWQASVKDEDIKKVILQGGAAVGKSPAMPANPDLEGKPELDGLVAIVRAFGK